MNYMILSMGSGVREGSVFYQAPNLAHKRATRDGKTSFPSTVFIDDVTAQI